MKRRIYYRILLIFPDIEKFRIHHNLHNNKKGLTNKVKPIVAFVMLTVNPLFAGLIIPDIFNLKLLRRLGMLRLFRLLPPAHHRYDDHRRYQQKNS